MGRYTKFVTMLLIAVFAAALWMPAASAATPPPVTGTTVASWAFNQASGTTVTDSTGRGHTATLDLTKPNFGFTYDTALKRYVGNFTNDNGLLLVGASSDLSPGTSDFGFGMTVKTTDQHSNLFQAGTTKAGHDFIKLEVASLRGQGIAGVPRCHFTGSANRADGGIILLGTKPITDGQWHTLRCDKYADKIVMRVDGVVVNTRKQTVGSIDVSKEKWSLGGKYMPRQTVSPTDMFTGQMRDAFIVIKR